MIYNNGNKVTLFLDTNVLESRCSGKKMFLSDIKASSDFYEIYKFIDDYQLNVELCIPQIVQLEIRRHLIKFFSSEYKSINDTLENYRKCFGSIIDAKCEFKINNVSDYQTYFEVIWAEFVTKYKCNIVSTPDNEHLLESVIDKAINTTKPFTFIEKKGHVKKDYSDAGFKDVIVCETISQYQITTSNKCILMSCDGDFNDVFNDDGTIVCCKNANEVKSILSNHFKAYDEFFIKQKIENDSYLKESLILETGNVYDEESVLNFEIKTITQDKEDLSTYNLHIECYVNEVIYRITCKYDSSGNIFFDINSETSNE